MPYINCRVMEGVLSDDQKAEIAEQFTETIVSVVGEPVRGLTWVLIDDMTSGQFTIGGRPVTTEGVEELLAGAPAGA
ncbi:MAG TPA: tautomerase family protein [Solirubrobacteraceae bacterium]|jgi:4-oxalocrotonate tautomerase|nr:tautomerase family protein [Solirubrobacteraceae bacterium]